MAQNHRILTITLNPAVDITTAVPKIEPETKLRCEQPRLEPGGGGINISRAIRELDGESTALVAIAGQTGDLLRDLLAPVGLDIVFLQAAGLTRQSLAVHDRSRGEQFRFVLPGPVQVPGFADQTLATLSELIAKGGYDYVAASGSLPPGMPENFYARLAETVSARGVRLILDTSGPPLEEALGHGVYLVKPDHTEAKALGLALGMKDEDPEALAGMILSKGGAEIVIITLGPDGALLASNTGCLRLHPPKVEVVSAVGAGDSFIGALCLALARDWPVEKAFAYGVAAATAAVLTEATELVRKADVERFYAALALSERKGGSPSEYGTA